MIEWLCKRFITGENVIISDAAKKLRNNDYNNNNNNNNGHIFINENEQVHTLNNNN